MQIQISEIFVEMLHKNFVRQHSATWCNYRIKLPAELHCKTISLQLNLKKKPARKHSPTATESSYLWKHIGLHTNTATSVTDLHAG